MKKTKGGRAGKQRQLGTDETNTVEKNLELILRMLKRLDPLEEKHAGWKRINMTTSMIKKD